MKVNIVNLLFTLTHQVYEETAYQHLYGEITDQQIGARTIVVLAR